MHGDDAGPDTPGPLLKIGDREFACHERVPTWTTMRLASAYVGNNDLKTYAAMHDFLAAALLPEEWSAFEEYAAEEDLTLTELDNGIGDLLAQMGGRGKESRASSEASSGGSTTPRTSPSSRVVSLSQGTVRMEDDSPEPASSTG